MFSCRGRAPEFSHFFLKNFVLKTGLNPPKVGSLRPRSHQVQVRLLAPEYICIHHLKYNHNPTIMTQSRPSHPSHHSSPTHTIHTFRPIIISMNSPCIHNCHQPTLFTSNSHNFPIHVPHTAQFHLYKPRSLPNRLHNLPQPVETILKSTLVSTPTTNHPTNPLWSSSHLFLWPSEESNKEERREKKEEETFNAFVFVDTPLLPKPSLKREERSKDAAWTQYTMGEAWDLKSWGFCPNQPLTPPPLLCISKESNKDERRQIKNF